MGFSAYHLDCDETSLSHDSSCCFDREMGRVRSAAFIRKQYLPQILASPDDISVWQAGIDGGHIVVIPQVSGSFDPGEPLKLKGYGTRLFTFGPRDLTLSFSDPNYKINYSLYNEIHKQTGLVLAFRSSSILHIADVPASITAKDVIEDDLETDVKWDVVCQWRSHNLPLKIDAANLISLFTCTPATAPVVSANKILLENSSSWLLEDGGKWLLEDTAGTGGGSTGSFVTLNGDALTLGGQALTITN